MGVGCWGGGDGGDDACVVSSWREGCRGMRITWCNCYSEARLEGLGWVIGRWERWGVRC